MQIKTGIIVFVAMTPTLPCAAKGCDHMAVRNRGPVRMPRFCAEHRHEIPGFENDRFRHHSYLSASTGSSRAARQAGNRVAAKDSAIAMMTTARVSPGSISAGNWLRK